jgi:hypothetical protein
MHLRAKTKMRSFPLLLLGVALAASTTNLMMAQQTSCTDTTSCFQSAASKIIEVDAISGNPSSGYAYRDLTDSLSWGWLNWPPSTNSPGGTIPYTFPIAPGGSYPSNQPFDLNPGNAYRNSTRGPFTLNSGFTVAMMVWNSTQSTVPFAVYWSFLDSTTLVDISLIRSGPRWGLRIWSATSGQYMVEYPWDISTGTNPAWNYIFYTFTPDGKCRIDLFVGSTYRSALLDLGRPDLGYTSGTPTSNPPQPLTPVPYPNYAYSLGNSATMRGLPGTGFVAVTTFQPLTQQEASSFYRMSLASNLPYTDTGFPCNTGLALNVTAAGGAAAMPNTPCGNVSNWSYTTAPASPTVSFSSNNLTFTAADQAQPVTVTNTGSATLNITGVSLTGADPDDFTESDDCTGSSIAPGAACTISVAAEQLPSGDSGAFLVITSNAVIPGIVQLVEAPTQPESN